MISLFAVRCCRPTFVLPWLWLLVFALAVGVPPSRTVVDPTSAERDDGDEREEREEREERNGEEPEERSAKNRTRTYVLRCQVFRSAIDVDTGTPGSSRTCARSVALPAHPATLSMRRLI